MTTPTNQLSLIDGALKLQSLLEFRRLIVDTMESAMKEGTHYGKIPGTNSDKPTLLLPGAQLLCTLFRLRPEYEITETEPMAGHRRFQVKCKLYLLGDPPVIIAEGVGESSTMESKHRYRNAALSGEDTGDEPPGLYWNKKREQGFEAANLWLGEAYEAKVTVRKVEGGKYHVIKVTGGGDSKVENPNPADQWNTVLKVGKKRAYVDATITATASGDFFTQDLEDILENLRSREGGEDGAGSHGTPEGGEKRGGATVAAQESAKIGDWRLHENHIGKKGGPIHGRTLGELDDGSRGWLLRQLNEKDENRRTKQDKKLLAALLLWQREQAESNAPKRQEPREQIGGKDQGDVNNAGIALETLAENLEWAGIPNDIFLSVAQKEGLIAGTKFEEITDKEAGLIIDDFDNLVPKFREAMQQPELPGS